MIPLRFAIIFCFDVARLDPEFCDETDDEWISSVVSRIAIIQRKHISIY